MFADWDKVSVEFLREDDGKCLVNCGGIGIGWDVSPRLKYSLL